MFQVSIRYFNLQGQAEGSSASTYSYEIKSNP